MKRRPAEKVMKALANGKNYRHQTVARAADVVGKFAPAFAQPIRIRKVQCQNWAQLFTVLWTARMNGG